MDVNLPDAFIDFCGFAALIVGNRS